MDRPENIEMNPKLRTQTIAQLCPVGPFVCAWVLPSVAFPASHFKIAYSPKRSNQRAL